MKSRIKRILKDFIPLLSVLLMQLIAYYASRLFTLNKPPVEIMLPLDTAIPLCTPFIIVYILAFIQWTAGYLLLLREERKVRHHFCAAHLVAELICFAVYVLFPTEMPRPEIVGQSVFDQLTRLIYRYDTSVNLLPSIHCMQSWFCLRMALATKRRPRWYVPFTAVFSLLVMLSTLLVKQHVLLDVPAGILAAEIGIFLCSKFRINRIFDFFYRGEMA